MKRTVLILIPLLLASMLMAWEFSYDGEFRTRAAIYNDWLERNDGHVDNKLDLGFNAQLHPNLKLRAQLRMGDQTWGNWGGLIPASVGISAYELYADYRIDGCESNIRVGQQYWADPMSLILDDSFSGVTYTKDNLFGFKSEFGWAKVWEGGSFDDDNNYFLVNLKKNGQMPWGVFASYAQYGNVNYDSYTLMPYVSVQQDPITIDAAAFMGMHFYNNPNIDNELGFGAAVKANVGVGNLSVGGDLLFATENGIVTLSPYYQNGLFIYGLNIHNDALSLYWGTPYSGNNDTFLSIVGNVKAPLSEKMSAFGAAGYLLDQGFEVNGGIEYKVIPNLFHVAGYGAVGMHENDTTNFAFGTTINVPFK